MTMARTGPFDMAAVGLSGLCLVHCLGLPLLAASLPLLGAWAEAEWLHWTFVALAVPVSIIALWRPLRKGLGMGPLGLALLGIAALFAGVLGWPTEADETWVTVSGSLLLAAAHLLNWHRSRHRHWEASSR